MDDRWHYIIGAIFLPCVIGGATLIDAHPSLAYILFAFGGASIIWGIWPLAFRKVLPITKPTKTTFQKLQIPLSIFSNKENPCCNKFEEHYEKNSLEQFFRLGITNSNSISAINTEIILTGLTREDSDGKVTTIPIAQGRLKPFGDEKESFEIEARATRYVNIAYMNTDFNDEISICFSHYEQGNANPIPMLAEGARYNFELLVRSSNSKAVRHIVSLERPNKYWSFDMRVKNEL